jgi:hypothetical protein
MLTGDECRESQADLVIRNVHGMERASGIALARIGLSKEPEPYSLSPLHR